MKLSFKFIITLIIIFAMMISVLSFSVSAEVITWAVAGAAAFGALVGWGVNEVMDAVADAVVPPSAPSWVYDVVIRDSDGNTYTIEQFTGGQSGTSVVSVGYSVYDSSDLVVYPDTAPIAYELETPDGRTGYLYQDDIDAAYSSYVSSLQATTVYGGATVSLSFNLDSTTSSTANTAASDGYISGLNISSNRYSYVLSKSWETFMASWAHSGYAWFGGSSNCYRVERGTWFGYANLISDSFMVSSGEYIISFPSSFGIGFRPKSYSLQRYDNGSWATVQSVEASYTSTSSTFFTEYDSNGSSFSAVLLSDASYRLILRIYCPEVWSNSGPAYYNGYSLSFMCANASVSSVSSDGSGSVISDRPTTVNLRPVSEDSLGDLYGVTLIDEVTNTFSDPRTFLTYE